MNEKRMFRRYSCLLKAKFKLFEGDPESIELSEVTPQKGKGRILDISQGGIFIASNSRAGINHPIIVEFKINHKRFNKLGMIVRTGIMKNNPSEVVAKYKKMRIREDSYLAIRFEEPLTNLESERLDSKK